MIVSPERVGVVPERLATLMARARREIDQGLLPSCQIALARDGRLAAFETLGDATDETRYPIFSATKPIVASAVWLLMGEGAIDVSVRVADLIPEFAANGKADVTIEHVMLHAAGFPHAEYPLEEWEDREARVRRFASWTLDFEPGTAYEYHPSSAHWVLAEIITRVSGMDHRSFVRERITVSLGLPGLRLGVPPAEQSGIAQLVGVGEPCTADELEAAVGIREIPEHEVTQANLLRFNQPEARAPGHPGGGAVATAAEVALYYQALLRNDASIWKPEVVADATSRVRTRLPDPVFGVPANRGLGVWIAGDDGLAYARGFGRTTSPRAFGHNGAGGQLAWADPETGISFCYLTNGLDANQLRLGRRGTALGSLAAVCADPHA